MVIYGYNCASHTTFMTLFDDNCFNTDFWETLFTERDDVLSFFESTDSEISFEDEPSSFGQYTIKDFFTSIPKKDINILSDNYFNANKDKIIMFFNECLADNPIYQKLNNAKDICKVLFFYVVLMYAGKSLDDNVYKVIIPLLKTEEQSVLKEKSGEKKELLYSDRKYQYKNKSVSAGENSYAYLRDNKLYCYYSEDDKNVVYNGIDENEIITGFDISSYGAIYITFNSETGKTKIYAPNNAGIELPLVENACSVALNECQQYAILNSCGEIVSEIYGTDKMRDIVSFTIGLNLVVGINSNDEIVFSDNDEGLAGIIDKSIFKEKAAKLVICNDTAYLLTTDGKLIQYSEGKQKLLYEHILDFGLNNTKFVILNDKNELIIDGKKAASDVKEFDASSYNVIYKIIGNENEVYFA